MRKYILGFAVLLAVTILLIGCGTKTTVYPPQGQDSTPTQPTQTTTGSGQSSSDSGASNVPITTPNTLKQGDLPELKDCESDYAIGWIPNSCEFRNNNLKITLKAAGNSGIDGIVFYVVGPTEIKENLIDNTRVEAGGDQSYDFSVKDLEGDLGGSISKIFALPIKTMNGNDYACFNQRLIVIKDSACRG